MMIMIAQLRNLDRAACVACDTIRSRRCSRCNFCGNDTPLRDLSLAILFRIVASPDTRVQRPMARLPFSCEDAARSQCHQVTSLDDSPLPNCSVRDVVLTERDKQSLAELRRASAMALRRCIVSRNATAWAESLNEAISDHQSWALLCSAVTFAACFWLRSPQALTETRN